MQETRVWSLSQEDPLEEEMPTHSSILAGKIPRSEEPGRLQSMRCKESDMTEWVSDNIQTHLLIRIVPTTALKQPFQNQQGPPPVRYKGQVSVPKSSEWRSDPQVTKGKARTRPPLPCLLWQRASFLHSPYYRSDIFSGFLYYKVIHV